MKFKLLHCLAVAFACVFGTCGISVWADEIINNSGGGAVFNPISGEEVSGGTIDSGSGSGDFGGGSPSGESSFVFNGNSFKLGELTLCVSSQYLYQGECLECNSNNDKGLQLYLDDGTCRKCPAGTLTNSTGDGCDCSDGTHWNGSTCVSCGLGQYWSNSYCVQCPEEFDTNSGLYSFVKASNDSGVSSCTVKLNVNKSNCGTGTNVLFKYNTFGLYVVDRDDYVCNPGAGFVCLYDGSVIDDDNRFYDEDGNLKDICDTECLLGQYLDGDTCKPCPLEGTNAENSVSSSSLFKFVKYGDGKGVGSCAIKLTPVSCGNGSYVLYVYDTERNKYIRTKENIYPTETSIINANWPAEDELGTEFCTSCGGITWPLTDSNGQQRPFHAYYYGKPFNVENECTSCAKPGYYLYFSGNSFGCDVCHAGYYCQGIVYKTDSNGEKVCIEDITAPDKCLHDNNNYGAIQYDTDDTVSRQELLCPENTYSEEGATECTPCAPGYSTAASGPAEQGYDGFCRYVGQGCMSSDACKLVSSSLSLQRSGHTGNTWLNFVLGKNIKVESLNKSAVKSVSSRTNN